MPRLPTHMLEAVAFIYGSERDANEDGNFLATAFVVCVPSSVVGRIGHFYVVTNWHVIEKVPNPVLRFNSIQEGCSIRVVKESEWQIDEDHDIAVAEMVLREEMFSYVPYEMLLTPELGSKHKIGPGDELFLVSRYPRDKKQYPLHNHPLMRFGNISMWPTGLESYFTIELRSIGGHSGSPVFVYDNYVTIANMWRTDVEHFSMFLLGIDLGHVLERKPVVSYDSRKKEWVKHPAWKAESNVALSQVTPAWDIAELINREFFKRRRTEFDNSPGPSDFKYDQKKEAAKPSTSRT